MTVEETVAVIDAVRRVVETLLWPGVVLFVVLRYAPTVGPALGRVLEGMTSGTLKAGNVEISITRQQTEAAAALTAAAVAPRDGVSTGAEPVQSARDAAQVVRDTVTPSVVQRAERATVLWVDDHPKNNVNERRALEALGVTFLLAESTDDALRLAQQRRFDAIISDMNRGLADRTAGLDLLDKLRAAGDRTPYIIYAGGSAARSREDALAKGAIGCTNRADELFQMVLGAIAA